MARRLVSPSGSSMAVVLLLAVAVAAVLSNAPSSALASSSLPASSETRTGSSEQQQAPPPSGSDDDKQEQEQEQAEQEMDPEKQKEKEKERQVAKEKAVEEEKAAQQELLKYAQEKHLVSPTNGTGWYKGIAREFVDAHNELRARYGVTPMKWNKKLARLARRWSNAMRMDCQLKHSGGHEYGQSVFRSHDNWNATAKDAVLEWGKEEVIYDKQREKCLGGRTFKECGHFALMVAKRSTKVGCARAECFKGGVFITCNYYASDLDKDKNKNKSSN